jgi:hypothetical protein
VWFTHRLYCLTPLSCIISNATHSWNENHVSSNNVFIIPFCFIAKYKLSNTLKYISIIVFLILFSSLSYGDAPEDAGFSVYAQSNSNPQPSPAEECAISTGIVNNQDNVCGTSYLGATEVDQFGVRRGSCEIYYRTGGTGSDCDGVAHIEIVRSRRCGGNRKYIEDEGCQECVYPYSKDDEGECTVECNAGESFDGISCYVKNTAQQCPASAGNPIVISTGEKVQIEPLLYRESRALGLEFGFNYASFRERHYGKPKVRYAAANSFSQPSGYGGTGGQYSGLMRMLPNPNKPKRGYAMWRHSYQSALIYKSGQQRIHMIRPTGDILRFVMVGDVYQRENNATLTIVPQDDGTLLYRTRTGLREIYNADGQLIIIRESDEIYLNLSYNTLGLLSHVTHSLGGALLFTYNSNETLQRVRFPGGSTVVMDYYISDDVLGSVTRNYSANGEEQLSAFRQYNYQDGNPFLLTGIIDESGVPYVTWTYDEKHRAISSEHADGVDKFTFDYSDIHAIKVTNPLGKNTIYNYDYSTDDIRLANVTGEPTVLCDGANKTYEYSAAGFVSAKTDWLGNRTTFVRDSQGRETSRTEAVGTPEAKIITTRWHATLPQVLEIREPKKIRLFEYNTFGKLLKTTVSPAL